MTETLFDQDGFVPEWEIDAAHATLLETAGQAFAVLDQFPLAARVQAVNELRAKLAEFSPFQSEPVDCVEWVTGDRVTANSWNPNSVAPPEMELLRLSIMADGYTQPIVTYDDGDETLEVVDGFHRNKVGKECADVTERVHGYLPVVRIRDDRSGTGDRMAATIRHNRARGKHSVQGMSEIVVDLKRRNWSDAKIGKELGMDPDEVLRLAQISGLAEAFADREFSQSWEAIIDGTDDDDLSVLDEELNGEPVGD